MQQRDVRGTSLLSALVVFSILVALLASFSLLLVQERARVRDARRIADMTRVQFGFESLFRETGSYADAAAGCGQVGANVASCSLAAFVPNIATMKDPGRHEYRITRVPDSSGYEVSFTLERTYDGLAAGAHTLSDAGIR